MVWCPKYRRNVLIDGVDERLKSILLEVAEETKSDVIEMEIIPYHVHLLVKCDPQFGIDKLIFIRMMKGRSSRYLHSEFPWIKHRIPSLWTNSYFVSTDGGTTLDVVKST